MTDTEKKYLVQMAQKYYIESALLWCVGSQLIAFQYQQLGLYRIVDFIIQLNKNNWNYYSAEYDIVYK